MEAKELRIGNYVQLYGDIVQVQRSDFSDSEHGIAIYSGKPIPLTEQWLIDFGFEKTNFKWADESISEGVFVDKPYYFEFTPYGMSFCKLYQIGFGYHALNLKFIEFVHDFQNLYFELTGKELTK
jgi:hypothetical protein